MAIYTLECAPESRGTGMSGSSCDPATPPCQLTAAVGNSIGIAAVSGEPRCARASSCSFATGGTF